MKAKVTDSCVSCGSCVANCPVSAIKFNANGQAEVDQTVCVGCGYCVKICPVEAIIAEEEE
ncbi:MAG: 4Fe-4S binding protein [Christensenellaceae bacterium]|jgi:ferredoxin|nr:4Fe-4S binding protein [Christensenellaceae bacterium]